MLRWQFGLVAALVNLLFNGFLAWLSYGRRPVVTVWWGDGYAIDLILTYFLLSFITTLLVGRLVRQMIRSGELAKVSWSRRTYWVVGWLPAGRWTRAALVAGLAAFVMAGLVLGAFWLVDLQVLSGLMAVLWKAGTTALLAFIVTPWVARAALADESGRSDSPPPAIPLAELPAGFPRNHARAIQKDMISYVEALADQGPILRIPLLGPFQGYFINDPALIREILVKQAQHFHKPFNVKAAANSQNIENLFTTDGELWQTLRKVMQPAFHARRINNYLDIMVQYSEAMVASWQTGERRDMPTEMMDLTLGITTRALFGRDMRGADAAGGHHSLHRAVLQSDIGNARTGLDTYTRQSRDAAPARYHRRLAVTHDCGTQGVCR